MDCRQSRKKDDGRWAMGDGRWAMGDGRWVECKTELPAATLFLVFSL
ncbi:hypothetical protein NHN17_16705 [Photobacterium sp. ZSDE20]|uniref:Uncharacterized protein n=1 Tax=Photobacterium pectinilyticum TaxID=2906793 RepID=A0ABT1N4L9_9GAMM|nr:hypothetical protein [Photobacterium sp. ZSDE20]MCQ1059690.1 hypothetical protein [Photobacterium sp. ZSDE20]